MILRLYPREAGTLAYAVLIVCALQSLCHAVPGISDVETTSASLSAGSVMPTTTAVITRMRRAAVSAGDFAILGATRAAMPVRSFGF